jgi:hypothetical protein
MAVRSLLAVLVELFHHFARTGGQACALLGGGKETGLRFGTMGLPSLLARLTRDFALASKPGRGGGHIGRGRARANSR